MAMTALSSTFVDLIIFLTNLYGFHRLEVGGNGHNLLMSMYFVHKILNRVLVWACEWMDIPPLPRGQWDL